MVHLSHVENGGHPAAAAAEPPCVMVIFGASGDLTRRKLVPALYALEHDGLLPREFVIVGFGRSDMDDARFRAEMREAVAGVASGPVAQGSAWERFAGRLHYVTGRYDDAEALRLLHRHLPKWAGDCAVLRHLYYFALPPSVTEALLLQMRAAGLGVEHWRTAPPRVMLEKPFGLDLASAQRLNHIVAEMFGEPQVYRIDHFLAKDTVRNLLAFRFANTIFEPVWNHHYVNSLQITVAEDEGVGKRGAYYDEAGVVRDMVQNHVLQVLALVAMEPPVAGDAESIRDRRQDVFRSLGPIARGDFVFGQYRGYRGERYVNPRSTTPTFVALRLYLNNWRWQGVPFYIRAGKCLPRKLTEVVIQFKNVPLCVLDSVESCRGVAPNVLTLRLQPDEGIRMSLCAQVPGRGEALRLVNLDFRYADLGVEMRNAYERVLLDCLRGVPTLFARADHVETCWRAMAPLLEVVPEEVSGPFPNYEPGTWGPPQAEDLLRRDGHSWQV